MANNINEEKLNRLFPPKFFNNSDFNNSLSSKQTSIICILRNEEYQSLYSQFDSLFGTYLQKLPNNSVKKYVKDLFEKDMVFIGVTTAMTKNMAIFSRIFLSNQTDSLSGIVLDSSVLNIDISTGETSSVDKCVYATYFGLLRAAVLLNTTEIKKDYDLHKLIISYTYLIMLRSLGRDSIYDKKKKDMLQLACSYLFHRQYFEYSHAATISSIKKNYTDLFNIDLITEFISIDSIKKYDNIKDIPKILIDLNIQNISPQKVYMSMISVLGPAGFYSFVSTLDLLLPMICIVKYPVDLYGPGAHSNSKVHDILDNYLSKLLNKIKFKRFEELYR